MFIDWMTIYQDFEMDLPYISNEVNYTVDTDSGDVLSESQPALRFEGSYSTSVSVRVSGRRVTIKGNPSRIGRLDNLFGFSTIDQCVSVYNQILLRLNLPPFTKATKLYQLTGEDGKRVITRSNGATIQELHITTNKSVGAGNVRDYLRSLSTQRSRNSLPNLHANGCTIDWLSRKGKAPLIYQSVYDKANEIDIHQLDKIKRKFGTHSDEYRYLSQVRDYCLSVGIARFEQKLKSRYLIRENLRFWGIHDFSKLHQLHQEFLSIDKNLWTTAMDFQSISDELINQNICSSTKAANSTAQYFYQWLCGSRFDLSKSAVKIHRARLRKLHIDIAEPCDVSRHSAVRVKEQREIEVGEVAIPHWYRKPSINHLRLVA